MTSAAALVGRSQQADLTRSAPRVPAPQVPAPQVHTGLLTLRQATPDDARAIHELITCHVDEGRLLPRHLGEIAVHTSRFIVAVGPASTFAPGAMVDKEAGHYEGGHYEADEILGCVDLAPLSRDVAEIRSLVVDEDTRSAGIGRRLIDASIARAGAAGFERVCAFTHAPSFFVQLGFSIVPHDWLPEKIRTDCATCTQFRTCGQYAVVLPLKRVSAFAKASTSAKAPVDKTADKRVPLASLHG